MARTKRVVASAVRGAAECTAQKRHASWQHRPRPRSRKLEIPSERRSLSLIPELTDRNLNRSCRLEESLTVKEKSRFQPRFQSFLSCIRLGSNCELQKRVKEARICIQPRLAAHLEPWSAEAVCKASSRRRSSSTQKPCSDQGGSDLRSQYTRLQRERQLQLSERVSVIGRLRRASERDLSQMRRGDANMLRVLVSARLEES